MTNIQSLLRVAGTACSILISFEALELMAMYSEVRDDGLKSVTRTLFSDVLLSIAPFGLTPFIVPLLVGTLYWILTFRSPPTTLSLIYPVGLALIGWTACAVPPMSTRNSCL